MAGPTAAAILPTLIYNCIILQLSIMPGRGLMCLFDEGLRPAGVE
jgi:hypothetical protein